MTLQSADLRKYKYFSTLSENSLEALSNRITIVTLPPHTEIIKEGELGDSFFFVKQGRLEITKKTKTGQVAKLSVIGSGHGFGEMALLTCGARSSSVKALTQVTLYQLPRKDFEDIVLHESVFKSMLQKKAEEFAHYNKIKTLQPFALLEPDKMYALMSRMTEKKYSLGEDIIVQGEKGDFYYIVKSGLVAVLKRGKHEQEAKQVAALTDGDGFGEEALIRDDPRNATCRALEETIVYALDKEDFNEIIKSTFLESAFSEDIKMDTYLDRYVIIDARVPPEYEEEHIKGAVNIPVEVLRTSYHNLDPSKEYLTYCTNDARGMVAAFLLKNHGFRAKCLRGGVSGWTGPLATNHDHDGVHMPV